MDLAPGRLTGYRRWAVIGDGTRDDNPFRMASLTARTVWPWIPEIRATCQRTQIGQSYSKFASPVEHDPEDVPNAACSCGIYATYTFMEPDIKQVAGAIEVWGPTIVGPYAFRGRHARLVGLVDPFAYSGEWRRRLEVLGERYRVPTFVSEVAFCKAFPASDVSSLLPPPPEPEREPDIGRFANGGAVYTSTGNYTPQQLAEARWKLLGVAVPPAEPSPREPGCWCGSSGCSLREPEPKSNPFIPPVF